MTRLSVFCLLFLGLIAMANSEELKRLRFTKTPRALAIQDPPKSVFNAYTYYFFSVAVDLGPAYTTQESLNNTSNPLTMLLMISSSETAFNHKCSGYSHSYYCKEPICQEDEGTDTSLHLPLFDIINATRLKVSGEGVTTPVSIINGSWQLNSGAPLYMQECQKHTGISYPENTYTTGFIGLGTKGDASKNFLDPENPIFSTHLNASKHTGELIFGFDKGRTTDVDHPVITIKSDEQWTFQVTNVVMGDYKNTLSTPLTVVFDLNYENIVFPQNIFDNFKSRWGNKPDLNIEYCGDENYSSSNCRITSKNPQGMESIVLTLADGQIFTILPDYFWINNDYDPEKPPSYTPTFYLKMEGVSADATTTKDVTTPEEGTTTGDKTTPHVTYDYIVLGSRFMSLFYQVFEKKSTGNTITLYKPTREYPGAVYTPTTPDQGTTNPPDQGTTNPPDQGTTNPPDQSTTNPPGQGTTNPPDQVGQEPTNNGGYLGYYIAAVVSAVVVIAVIAFFCCKKAPRNDLSPGKSPLTVELKAGRSAESNVASGVRL